MRKRKTKRFVSRTSSDVAAALGLDRSIAIEWEVRHQVTSQIIHNVNAKKMTVTALAQKSKTSRARITRILKADTASISLDVLMRVLGATGQRVEIRFLKAS